MKVMYFEDFALHITTGHGVQTVATGHGAYHDTHGAARKGASCGGREAAVGEKCSETLRHPATFFGAA